MKIIKESIDQIEQIKDGMDVQTAINPVMGNAVVDSEKADVETEKQIPEAEKIVKETEPFTSGEHQPKPEKPIIPSITLDESLFEDVEVEEVNEELVNESSNWAKIVRQLKKQGYDIENMDESLNEDYGWEIAPEEAMQALDEVVEALGAEEVLDSITHAMGYEDLADVLAYICRMHDLKIASLKSTKDEIAGLPEELIVDMNDFDIENWDDDVEVNDVIADFLSDMYGYAVESFAYELDKENNQVKLSEIVWDLEEALTKEAECAIKKSLDVDEACNEDVNANWARIRKQLKDQGCEL